MRTGNTGAPLARAKRMKPRRHCPSRTPFRPSRDTSPAGNTITHCSSSSARSTARSAPAPAVPANTGTGSSSSRRPSNAINQSLAMMRTSCRTCPTASSSARASTAPDGWLATISSRPVGGIRANASASTRCRTCRWSNAARTKPKPRKCALAARNCSAASSPDQRPSRRSSGAATAARGPVNHCGQPSRMRRSSRVIALSPAVSPRQAGGGTGHADDKAGSAR